MVVAVTELDLLVVCLNLLTEALWLAEVEWGAGNLQNLTSRNSGLVSRQIEIGIDFADLVLNGWCGICCACKTEECVVGQVDNGILVGSSQILDDEFVLVSESVLNGYVQLACVAFLTIGRNTMQCQ